MATMKTIFILKCGSIFFLFIYSSVPSIPFHSPIHISHPIHSIHHSHPFHLSFPFMYPFHPSHWFHPCTHFTHSIHPFISPIHSFYLFITFIHLIYSSQSTYHIFPIQLVILFIPFIHSVLQDDYTKIQLDNTLPKIPSTFSTSHFVGNEKRVEDLLQREGNFLGSFLVEKKR